MFGTSAHSNSAKAITGLTRRLLITTAAVIGLAPAALAQSSAANGTAPKTFFVLDNQKDNMFNQLLGINSGDVIVGYFGDGAAVPNNGYVLVPSNHYSEENFIFANGNTASQTQAIGINENRCSTNLVCSFSDIVGFYTDPATSFTHGFLDSNGVQSAIDDPAGSPPNVTATPPTMQNPAIPTQNLLGINNAMTAAGFWTDNNYHTHGFVVEINTQTPSSSKFIELPSTGIFAGAVATQASGINDNNLVCGFWTDATGNDHAFEAFFSPATGTFVSAFELKPSNLKVTVQSTQALGCNNNGEVVGTITEPNGNVHGFIFDTKNWHQYDAAGSVQAPIPPSTMLPFGVRGTTINGINIWGHVVGFFTDGQNVNGFLDFAPVQ